MTNDIGRMFSVMQAQYGKRWEHGADAIPVWLAQLNSFRVEDVMNAAHRASDVYPEWPPSSGEFKALVRDGNPKLPNPNLDDVNLATRVYNYTRPESKSNPQGNPHRVSLPESVAARIPGESAEQYRKRISDAVTLAMYPRLGPDGRSLPGAYNR